MKGKNSKKKLTPLRKFQARNSIKEYIPECPVKDITPREMRTRTHTKETQSVLEQELELFGWVSPILVDEGFNIVDGQYRYDVAVSQGWETVPVLVVSGTSKKDGSTDVYNLLGNRIVEWDKWNFAATDEILSSLDGGLKEETLLDQNVLSEKGLYRELAAEIGWFVNIVPKVLTGSTMTLERLGELLTKQLAGKYHFDPAQLLYIEAFREELQKTREEMIANGDTSGGVKEKLSKHLAEEEKAFKEGEGAVSAITNDDGTVFFNIEPELRYIAKKNEEKAAKNRVTVEKASDTVPLWKTQPDGRHMGLQQFKILCYYFQGMTLQDAENLYNSLSKEEFNKRIVDMVNNPKIESIDPVISKRYPQTHDEAVKEIRHLEKVSKNADKLLKNSDNLMEREEN